jgi:hypothetical protein
LKLIVGVGKFSEICQLCKLPQNLLLFVEASAEAFFSTHLSISWRRNMREFDGDDDVNLDDEEREIVRAFEAGEFVSILTPELREKHREIARATLQKLKDDDPDLHHRHASSDN